MEGLYISNKAKSKFIMPSTYCTRYSTYLFGVIFITVSILNKEVIFWLILDLYLIGF